VNIMSKDVYDYLAKESVSELNITNLDAASSSTAVDRTNVTFWGGPITLARVMEATRTYPHGLPIPEASAIDSMSIDDASSDTLKPTSPGIFQIVSIFSSADVSLQLTGTGGTTLLASLSAGAVFLPPYPLKITPTLYLQVANTSGGTANVTVAYHTVGL
jgi:hypothetical protein